jgi:hypothetical protein
LFSGGGCAYRRKPRHHKQEKEPEEPERTHH